MEILAKFCFYRLLFIHANSLGSMVSKLGLRMSALKLRAPFFNVYDRTMYQRLVPYHLADLKKFPPKILEHLTKGFTLSLNGEKGHALAIDKSHEMCVNKDMKMAITHPTKPYLQKVYLFLRYRISVHKNLLT